MSIDDILKELQQEYIQSIPQKIMEIQTHLQQKDIESLINAFHKLKGSGKTYGIDEISHLGQFFESWLREKKEAALPFIEKSSVFLQKIHTERKKNQSYAIENDPEFIKLQALK